MKFNPQSGDKKEKPHSSAQGETCPEMKTARILQ